MKNFNAFVTTIVVILGLVIGYGIGPEPSIVKPILSSPSISLVNTTLPDLNTGTPIAKMDASVWYYLQSSVRVIVGDSAGSGTICYYDELTGEAYIISCGHLFDGNKIPNGEGTKQVNIDVFYKNDTKLKKPQRFKAEVISYDNVEDISILKFRPDWKPNHYFPIAPLDYTILPGDILESTGCDDAGPTAAYTVVVIDGTYSGPNLISKYNSPRPGRSGGGLLSADGYHLGITWGTSKLDGSGYGFYVPLRRIHAYLNQFEAVSWLLEGGRQWRIVNTIPIVDADGVLSDLPNSYIPLP